MTTKQPGETSYELLLVESNPGDVLLFRKCLRKASVPTNLHVAGDEQEALRFLEHQGEFHESPRPDLIIMDLALPKLQGLELLERVKKSPNLRQIPVIVLAGPTAEQEISKSYDLHANCYITKPAGLAELIPVVDAITHYWLEIATLSPPHRED